MRNLLTLFAIASVAVPAQKNAAERQIFEAVNHARKDSGLRTLKWDEALAAAARMHANQMAKRRTLEHSFPGEPNLPSRATKAGARFISISENIVRASSVKEAHSQFMHSASHKANILDRDIDSIGVGVVQQGNELFVVQDFSKTKR